LNRGEELAIGQSVNGLDDVRLGRQAAELLNFASGVHVAHDAGQYAR
jgi:hypothetical protein